MYVSVEVMAIVFSAVGVLVALGGSLFAALAWGFKRMDVGFAQQGEQLSLLRSEVQEVKVAVARLEGPQQRLILPR